MAVNPRLLSGESQLELRKLIIEACRALHRHNRVPGLKARRISDAPRLLSTGYPDFASAPSASALSAAPSPRKEYGSETGRSFISRKAILPSP